jgi:hypothetical protein
VCGNNTHSQGRQSAFGGAGLPQPQVDPVEAVPLRTANELIGMRIAAAMKPTSNPDGLAAKKIVRLPAQPRRASAAIGSASFATTSCT